ncbi:MAG: response regulator [Nitrospirae bacterium]|nr:response regulator [Nitrospirota bacterium]
MAIIPRILLVDDEEDFIESVKPFLQADNFHVTSCLNSEEALKAIHKEFYDIVICDVYIPFFGLSEGGLEVAKMAAEKNPACFIIVISQYVTEILVNKFLDALPRQKFKFLNKSPNLNEDLMKFVKEGLKNKFIFVCMPFDDKFEDVYKLGIKGAVEELGFICKRADGIQYTGGIIKKIYEFIRTSHVIVADMTGKNPNVFYEVGYAHAIEKEVILTTQNVDDIPTDLKNFIHIKYEASKITKLKDNLKQKIQELFL